MNLNVSTVKKKKICICILFDFINDHILFLLYLLIQSFSKYFVSANWSIIHLVRYSESEEKLQSLILRN